MVLVTEDVGEKLLPKFAKKAEDMNVNIVIVPNGSIEQLKELVTLVARGEVSIKSFSLFLKPFNLNWGREPDINKLKKKNDNSWLVFRR